MSTALTISARSFVKGEELYVNAQQSDAIGNWTKDDAKLYLYFFGSNGNMWLDLQSETGNIYKAVFTSSCTYDSVIVVRKNPANATPDWNGVWNQTGNIDMPNDWNCIDNFNDASHRWKMYSPALDKIAGYAASLTEEKISVCPNSAGDPLSLKAKLNSAKTDYAYSDVHGHGWYSSPDKSTWTSLDNYHGAVRDGEHLIDTIINLPNPIPTGGIYYYLHSSLPAGRRLIYIIPDADNCELDCSITSFETAISAVNADDSTYTLDGMVAFGKANGNLIIECDGKSITITDPKSPQSFSLHGVPAATISGRTTMATAYFLGDSTNCSKSITFNVPNATEAVITTKLDSLTGHNFVLQPQGAEPTNQFVWLVRNEATGQVDTVQGATQTLTINALSTDTTVTYIYKEYYPATGSMEDLMNNGSYEDPSANYGTYGIVSTISDYNFWGNFPQTAATKVNFYTDTLTGGTNPNKLNKNGFAVVCNANNFWKSYANVQAREGNNFALFDAETGSAGGNKKAWYANTANNPKLKLQKGTTYVLSFWAANINNYGEMDNAAKFVFRIEYNGKTWESGELDLSKTEFRNNIWHQHSETFYAAEDCDNVTISVVNKNTNTLNIGNDFALDDIQFHPISSVSKVVKSQQQFVITAHKPKIDVFTVTPQPIIPCGANSYVVNMHVEYQNPSGQLIIKDKTTNTEYPYPAVSPGFDMSATIEKSESLAVSTISNHEWEAYFENWPAASLTANSTEPISLPCANYYDTICEGNDYTLNGFNIIAPPVGDSMHISSIGDTLYLTVEMANRMYSKWTDVIFISNPDGRFLTYQWYANGVEMPGETQQRLYDPNGLSGTTTLYNCRVTTTDGLTLYTCPLAFDDITPSRTQNTDTQVPSKTIYDTMGRIVTGPLSRGIYILVEHKEGEIFTHKIIINE